MDRNREARRGSMVASANGLSRRRHRSNSLRDSPEEDGPVELQEPARLRDRGLKKDRDRDRDRDRERDRPGRSKRRRGDRLMHGSNREDGGEDSSEESVNDEEDDEDDDGGGGPVRMSPPNPVVSMSSSLSNHQHQHRKNFPPSATAKVFRPAPGWKPADEMIGFSVPRKARSASTKRSHECGTSGTGVGREQILRQASTSPVRPGLASTSTPSPAPISPSSSNVSLRKKMPNGSKPRPPKSSSKSSSSNPEELEIEIAEVLYGLMTQSQGPSKKEIMANDFAKFDSREMNKSSTDAKSRVSSPISNSTLTAPHSSVLPQNSSSSATPLSAVAPKRKRPRQVSDNLGSFSVRNSPISSTSMATMKVEIDQPPKNENSSLNLEKNAGSAAENGSVPHDFAGSQLVPPSSEPPPPESARPETASVISESKPETDESRESQRVGPAREAAVTSPKKESPAFRPEDDRKEATATKANSSISETEIHREEKFQIDLMAPPPQLRSSPEREGETDFSEHKSAVPEADAEMRPMTEDKEEEKVVKSERDEAVNVEPELKKAKATAEEAESQKPVVSKERNIDLQLDLEKPERDSGTGTGTGVVSGNKLHPHAQKQQLKATRDEPPPPHTEKTAQSSSLPLPMSVASWPGGLPPMGYMGPLQGVVSMDGSPVPSTTIPPLFSQPRPKRCATHCYIARNIHYFQQFMKMNPFWPAAAASAPLFGGKPCNLNVVPSAELHGNIAGRSVNSLQDKGQGLAIFPGHSGKDKGSQAANIGERKQQILLQQALPPGAPPSNIMHGPAFIFPLNQQQPTAAASVRPGSAKSPASAGGVASISASNPASANGSATAAPALSFNYPNMPGSDTQYLAILQNNPYPFPIPSVGAPTYRGSHAQAIPYYNGSFYSSQMIHPLQLQPQQQPSSQPQQLQQGHQNTSISSGSSSSQKHLQSQQQRSQGSNNNGGNGSGNLHGFPAPKTRSSQVSQQQQPNQHIPISHQGRQLETDVGGEDSPSKADSRVSRATMSVYGQNFAVPIHHQNFALMTPPSMLAAAGGGGSNQGEKKQQQQPQQQGLKSGVDSLPPQTFAMSFASINGATTAPVMDLQSFPEAARHNYHVMATAAAAQAAQQKKIFRVSEEGRSGGGDSSSMDEGKKGLAGKAPANVGQSIAFARPDLSDASGSTIPGSTVIDSSARTLTPVSAPPRTSRSGMPNAMGTINTPNSQLHPQLPFYQQQQMIQLQKQQQQQQQHQQQQQQQQLVAAAAARNKTSATSNGSVYSDHMTSSSPSAPKFSNSLSAFQQNLVQSSSSSGSPSQSPQWKNSARSTSQVPSALASSTTASLKNLPQQQARTQQNHNRISFGASQKSSTAPQGQQAPNSHQSPSPPMVVGSPTTSSISKGAGGSPRTATSTSQGNKTAQPSTLSTQQSKNSASIPSRKSSPVGSRNVTSILGNPHITSSSTGTKTQMLQQQQQQQLQKQTLQQQQLFFSPAYMHAQAPHSTGVSSMTSTTSGYYLPRRRAEQQQQSQLPQGSSSASSNGMSSLANANTSDAKAVAAAVAASNIKGGGLSQNILHHGQFTSQSSGNSHPLVPGGFSYVHTTLPAAVQVKPSEQKQPAA